MTAADIDEFEARLPDRVPFGSNSGMLALRLDRTVDPIEVVLIRTDAGALHDLVFPPFPRARASAVSGEPS